jgi:hypothetical protein
MNTCTSCGRHCKDESHICEYCYELAVQIALMDSKEREYLWRDNRPKLPLPPGFWWLVVAGALIWGWTFWRFLK